MPLHVCGVHTCDFYSYFSVFYRYSSSGDSHSFDLWWLFVRMDRNAVHVCRGHCTCTYLSCNNLLKAGNFLRKK